MGYMSFLNNSVNYSLQQFIKEKLSKLISLPLKDDLLFITSHTVSNSTFNILLFMSSNLEIEYYIEINQLFYSDYVVECSDVGQEMIYLDNIIYPRERSNRDSLHEIFYKLLPRLKNLGNSNICISIKVEYDESNNYLLELKENDYNGVCDNVIKTIEKTNSIDVYNVYNKVSGNQEGILYIKTLYDSVELYKLFDKTTFLDLSCNYNVKFKKWQWSIKNKKNSGRI